jgi:hypothetical protein
MASLLILVPSVILRYKDLLTFPHKRHNSASASTCKTEDETSTPLRISGAMRIVASSLMLGGVPVITE